MTRRRASKHPRFQGRLFILSFRGFSTVAARPLLNIHDFAVAPEHRRRGLARALLAAVEEKAREIDCCKLTLEVLEHNLRAQGVYRAHGFEADPSAERSFFYTKKLSP